MRAEAWLRAERAVGAALTVVASSDVPEASGHITSFAARALTQRGLSQQEATKRVIAGLAEVYGVGSERICVRNAEISVELSTRGRWLHELQPDFTVLRRSSQAARAAQPTVRLQGTQVRWAPLVEEVGLDAAIWSVLESASSGDPFVVGPSLPVLASRLDANPLSHLRRAHAALTGRLARGEEACREHALTSTARDGVLTTLALLDRATYDSLRTQRSRPVAQAVSSLAAAVLHYLDVTPVTRTDLPLSEVARTVLADALTAAQLPAPVPY